MLGRRIFHCLVHLLLYAHQAIIVFFKLLVFRKVDNFLKLLVLINYSMVMSGRKSGHLLDLRLFFMVNILVHLELLEVQAVFEGLILIRKLLLNKQMITLERLCEALNHGTALLMVSSGSPVS